MTRHTPPPMRDELLTYEEAAAVLRISKSSIKNLVYSGNLISVPPTPNSQMRRIKRSELESYIEHLGAA